MKYSTDTIQLDWCDTHKDWYVDNNNGRDECPKCIAKQIEQEHEKEKEKLEMKIERLQNELDELGNKE